MTYSYLTHLECSRTGEHYDPAERQFLSKAGAPLVARYDLERARKTVRPESLSERPFDLWRYHEVLPLADEDRCLRLGEGGTPLIEAKRLKSKYGLSSCSTRARAPSTSKRWKQPSTPTDSLETMLQDRTEDRKDREGLSFSLRTFGPIHGRRRSLAKRRYRANRKHESAKKKNRSSLGALCVLGVRVPVFQPTAH